MSDPILNTDPDYRVSHTFSTDDITGTFSGLTQGDVPVGETPVIDFTATPIVTKDGASLYPINSEFGFNVTDFDGAEQKDFIKDPEYSEGWAGDLIGAGGEQLGLVVSNAPTDTFKTPALLGTWLAGLGGNTVKASTEHYVVMQNVLSDQRYPGDPDAVYPLDDHLIIVGGTYAGQAVIDVLPIVGDVNGDGVTDIKDVLQPNESTIAENIAVSTDYSVTLKDDGKLLYRWGNTVKRPNDVRIETELPLPDEWSDPDPVETALLPLFRITQAELLVNHTITNNPNDQIRPEDYENEAAIGKLPTYEILPDGKWVSTDDYYAGDGTFYPAGTVLRDPALATAVKGTELDQIGALSGDLAGGFTNAWYTTMDREPFEAELNDAGNYVTGPRWRLQTDKYGQDLPSVVIPADPSLPPPPTKDQVKYEVGTDTQTVINLLDWAFNASPLSISAGWQGDSNGVTENGLNKTKNFDLAFYLKGDVKPATLYSTELLMDYEEITINAASAAVNGTSADDYLVGRGGNTFSGDNGAPEPGNDMFGLSYGVIGNWAQIQTSTVTDFEVGKDTLALIDLSVNDIHFRNFVQQDVVGGNLEISLGDFDLVTLQGVTAELALEDFLLINRNMMPVTGTAGDDYLVGVLQNDEITAYAGNDVILSMEGNDIVRGGEGDDTIKGKKGDDTLNGNRNDDIIFGNMGEDTIDGGWGKDTIDGGVGADRLFGGGGNDTFLFSLGQDYIDGELGDDTAVFDGNQAAFTVVDNGGGSWSVTDLATGRTDTLVSIETLKFDDGDLFA